MTSDLVPVAQYLRMSTEHQQYSLENQAAAIQKYAEARDFHGSVQHPVRRPAFSSHLLTAVGYSSWRGATDSSVLNVRPVPAMMPLEWLLLSKIRKDFNG